MNPRQITKEEEGRIYAVKTYMLNHLHERLTTKQLARKAAMGEQKFREGFYEIFGLRTRIYLYSTRMLTARLLLLLSERPMKEVVVICGYREYKNFLKAYKKFYGFAAGTVRKEKRI